MTLAKYGNYRLTYGNLWQPMETYGNLFGNLSLERKGKIWNIVVYRSNIEVYLQLWNMQKCICCRLRFHQHSVSTSTDKWTLSDILLLKHNILHFAIELDRNLFYFKNTFYSIQVLAGTKTPQKVFPSTLDKPAHQIVLGLFWWYLSNSIQTKQILSRQCCLLNTIDILYFLERYSISPKAGKRWRFSTNIFCWTIDLAKPLSLPPWKRSPE